MKPNFLKSNDTVAIVAPSGRIFPNEIEEGVQMLKSWNLNPQIHPNLFEFYDLGYFYAGTTEQRLEAFQQALDDEKVKAIWCARGGYGAVHLLDKLDWSRFKQNPKWIIGYSDITAFHNHLNNWDIATLHAITTKKLNTTYTSETFDSLRTALLGENLVYEIPSHNFNKIGTSKGKLIGGNLSIIYSLLGSNSAIKGENAILFIEDWNENWYHVDRMMTNLDRNGILAQIKGLIIGSFTKMDVQEENENFDHPYDPMTYKVIQNIVGKYEIPVCYQFPAGHIGDNRALIMGEIVTLSVNEKNVTLEFNS